MLLDSGQNGTTYLAYVGLTSLDTTIQLLNIVILYLKREPFAVDTPIYNRIEHKCIVRARRD
jgi:hypothetical protein